MMINNTVAVPLVVNSDTSVEKIPSSGAPGFIKLIATLFLIGWMCSSHVSFAQKPRVVVLTDISHDEPDDAQSLIRFLLYANEFEVEGLIATTSIWRWRANDTIRPDMIRKSVQAYGKVRKNLMQHAAGYPTEASLLRLIKQGQFGQGMDAVGEGKNTEASRHIIAVVDKEDERPVWVLLWGGAIDLAQALWDVKHSRSQEEVEAFVAKLRVYEVGGQDNTGAWIAHTFPGIFWIRSAEQFQGISRRVDDNKKWAKARGGDESVFEADWVDKHIQSHGSLGALYPDPRYKHEGDTPAFLHLLPTGLALPEQLDFGNWGGRFSAEKQQNPRAVNPVEGQEQYEPYRMYVGVSDTWTYASTTYKNNVFAALFRWRTAFQHDFAARMDWSITADYKKANHNPTAAFRGDTSKNVVYLTVSSGKEVLLSAEGSHDPDSDQRFYEWSHYKEPGSYSESIRISKNNGQKTSFTAPQVSEPETIHIILTVKDDGEPSLYSYRRIVVTVEPM